MNPTNVLATFPVSDAREVRATFIAYMDSTGPVFGTLDDGSITVLGRRTLAADAVLCAAELAGWPLAKA